MDSIALHFFDHGLKNKLKAKKLSELQGLMVEKRNMLPQSPRAKRARKARTITNL